jgi:hypothetical protein
VTGASCGQGVGAITGGIQDCVDQALAQLDQEMRTAVR